MASTNYSPSPSILKSTSRISMLSKKLAQPSQVQFNPMVSVINVSNVANLAAIDIISILMDYIEGRNEVKYQQLLNLKNDPNVNDDFLFLILQQVNSCISLLSPKLEPFVDALLHISWTTRQNPILNEYLTFLQTLVSAHTFYCKPVVRMLVKLLTLNSDCEASAANVHLVLRGILGLIPLSHSIVWDALQDGFPYIGSKSAAQVNYIKNLLCFVEYHGKSGPNVLKLIIGRIIKLDSRVSREDLLQKMNQPMDFGDAVFDQAAETLDEIMKVMFELCQRKCQGEWEVHRKFYHDMYSTFESLILPASGIHHAHYLMFYICSTKTALYDAFTERLWVIFLTPSSPLNIRKSCADYLASFMGRASFVPMKFVIKFLDRVCKWIHSYLDRQSKGEGAAAFKIRAHAAFYAACHIPFYIVAARHRDIVNDRKLLGQLQAMDLNRIVSSPLNPLRYCHETTVMQFAESASHLQIVFCHTIIIRNQRVCIPEATTDTFVMDTEYPFEKYLLSSSKNFVSPLVIDKPIGRDDSLYDSDQVMEELLSESPRVGSFMHHFMG